MDKALVPLLTRGVKSGFSLGNFLWILYIVRNKEAPQWIVDG